MAKTPGGQIALIGIFNNSIDFGGATLTTFGLNDDFSVRVASDGQFSSVRQYGSASNETLGGIATDRFDRTIVGLEMRSSGTGNFEIGTTIPSGNNSIIFASYNEGTTAPVWYKVFSNPITLGLNKGVAVTGTNEVIGYGYYQHSPYFGGFENMPVASGISGFILKMDQGGNYHWQKQIGDGPFANGDQVTHLTTNRGGYIGVIGAMRSFETQVDAVLLMGPSTSRSPYFLILDSDGTAIWGKRINGSGLGYGYHVGSCPNGDFVFGGYTSAADFGNGTTIPVGSLNRESFVARYKGFGYGALSVERNGTSLPNGNYNITNPEDLGSAAIGTSSTPVTITLRNDGDLSVALMQTPIITGEHSADFILDTSATKLDDLTAGETTSFTVRFAPTSLGLRNASISFYSNDYERDFIIPLKGTGVQQDVTLAVSPSSVAEDGAANLSYTFTRNGPTTTPLTVNFTTSGTADAASDYALTGQDTFSAGTGTVTIPIGSASATVTLDPSADPVLEADETAVLTLAPGSGYSVGTPAEATGTIVNDDTEVSLAVAPASFAEDAPGTLAFTLTRNGPLGVPLTVNLTVSGSAGFGGDYAVSGVDSFSASAATVTFAPGASTAVMEIDPTVDPAVESDESVTLALAPGPGYLAVSPDTATATLVNDDTDVSVTVAPASVLEDGATNLVFTFTRVGVTSGSLTANFSVGGSASFGTDYTQSGAASFSSSAGTVSFAAGATTQTVIIHPTADQTDATDETVILTVTAGSGYNPGTTSAATGTILNDDIPQEIAVEQPSGTGLTSGVSSSNFGAVVNGASKTRTFIIRNLGTVPLTGVSVGKSGTHSGDFAITQPATTVNGGGSTTFTVTFTPTASGGRNATLSIASNDADENPFTIALSGTGGSSQQLLADAMAAAGLSGPNAQPGATPFNDGVSNLLKYAFNMNLAGPDCRTLVPGTGTVGLPVMRIVSGTVRYEFLRRKNSGLIYTPQQSSNLSNSGWQAASGTSTVTNIDENWERVEIQQAPGTARFFRVTVGLP
jgi:hypothetical protein